MMYDDMIDDANAISVKIIIIFFGDSVNQSFNFEKSPPIDFSSGFSLTWSNETSKIMEANGIDKVNEKIASTPQL